MQELSIWLRCRICDDTQVKAHWWFASKGLSLQMRLLRVDAVRGGRVTKSHTFGAILCYQ